MSYRLVLVEWIDSSSCKAGAWTAIETLIEDIEPLRIRSVGWVLTESDDVLVLASSLSGEKNENHRVMASGDTTIPKKCITKTTVLRRG